MSIINEMNLSTKQIEEKEIKLAQQMQILKDEVPTEVDISYILLREKKKWTEKKHHFPQNIFHIETSHNTFIGRKLVSQLKIQGKIKELNCSGISSCMLLGVFSSVEENEDEVCVYYHPFTNGEKLFFFQQLKNNLELELIYPYRYIDKETKKERTSPKEGWSLNKMRAHNLGNGEGHIRKYTINLLKQFDMKDKVVYDPACSTGQFLNTIKEAFPGCRTIGQDLSKQMVEYAKDYVDEVYHGDAFESPIGLEVTDFIFIRFLNSEVVDTTRAHELFAEIVKRAQKDSYIIVFGHTPILIYKSFFESLGLKINQTLAYDEELDVVFQYYVLKR